LGKVILEETGFPALLLSWTDASLRFSPAPRPIRQLRFLALAGRRTQLAALPAVFTVVLVIIRTIEPGPLS